MRLLRSKKKDNFHVRKFHMISTFVLLNYYHLSLSPHFSKSWHRDLSFCIVSYPCLSHCTDVFQHDLPFWVFSLLMTYLRWPVKALIHPLIVLWLFSCFRLCRYLFTTDLKHTVVYLIPITPVVCILLFDSLFKLFCDGNCHYFIFTPWVLPRTLLSPPHSFSLQPWQLAFLSPFIVHVTICQKTNYCIPFVIFSPSMYLILTLLFSPLFFHGWKEMATIILFILKHMFS